MTNRREFLQIGVAAGTWPIAARAAQAVGAGTDHASTMPLYKVVYDERFEDSIAFARRVETLGLPVHSIEGDMTRFWYDELYHEWRRGPAAIAGLTTHGPLFCLERLAWDQGMRTVFRAEHKLAAAGGCIEHELTGPLTMLHESLGARDAGAKWSTRMADVVAHCPSGRSEIVHMQLTAGSPVRAASNSESLYTWVIAPAVRG